ncbi:MAG: glutamate synthase subunit beta [Candidatus Omnitrophica bacterium]|nr:glutamate synthase subunit beta [Candidatus Omnitrophota bacterium]
MAKDVKAFLKTKREKTPYRPVCERIKDYKEVSLLRSDEKSAEQASRCMDCGTPFCHWACPVGNYIPEWNDAMISGRWEKALQLLGTTNNLPEITGRVCPAPCEYACVLGINDDPVTIRENELSIIEYGFTHGLIRPRPPQSRTGKKVAIIGSGPAGLSCAAQLNQAGHTVTVYEKDEKCGGILRYGIPDFKLEKQVIDRRLRIWEQEGVRFETNIEIGKDLEPETLRNRFDAICIATGSRVPRDLTLPGRDLNGIYFAMDYLIQNNRRIAGITVPEKMITAQGKRVVVIGGGDTGSDCVGTAHRQDASCVVQIELLPQPPQCRRENDPWPAYPMLLKTSSSHEEGGNRHWSVLTKEFVGKNGEIKKIKCVEVEFKKDPNSPESCPLMQEIPGSGFDIDADLVILAVGFLHPQQGLLDDLGIKKDNRNNAQTDQRFMTSQKGIFACGDAHRGQSLIVWAISEGRRAAHHIDRYLMGNSELPTF